jgi:probable F420-dependent oxidoreductase
MDVSVGPEQLLAAARAVEEAGFDAVWVTDHPIPYDVSSSLDKRGAPRMGSGHQTWDPFASLAWLAAGTSDVLLHTNAVVLPYRNPFVVAKAAATVQHLSGGRVVMSLAAGYLESEFQALGVDMKRRNEMMVEGVDALRAAWSGRPVEMSSPRWLVDGNTALPALDPPPPLWRGGNSRTAIEHAARSFDGWAPFEVMGASARMTRTAPLAADAGLRERIALFRELCADAGRPADLDICLVRSGWEWTDRSRAAVREELEQLREAGVTWIAATVVVSERDEWERRLVLLREIVSR